jgi:type I restriction enzyme R subunit
MAQTTEKAFETHAREILLEQGGWKQGSNAGWNKDLALFPDDVVAFIGATQPKLWGSMQEMHGAALQPMIIKTLAKELEIKGTLHVLRHGFKFYGKTFKLAYFKPANRLTWETAIFYLG